MSQNGKEDLIELANVGSAEKNKSETMVKEHERLIGRLRTVLATWFFVGMPLGMLLNGLYFVAGVPLPALLFFLSSLIYLSGSLLGGLWSGEQLRRKKLSTSERIGTLVVLTASVALLCVGIVFAIIGFRRL